MNQVVVKEKAPLDELMLAMDVVDTLRHKELMLAREVEADDREQRLVERLREIYTAQGITVSDDVLKQGVAALQEEPSWRDIPVIIVTARDLTAADRARLNSAVETVLLKDSFTPAQLVDRIRQLVPTPGEAESTSAVS